MAALPDIQADPTIEEMERQMERVGNTEAARAYMGASMIGLPCDRRIWLQFRWAMRRMIEARGLRAIEDGHRTEAVMAARLRLVEGLELWTEDPDTGKQIGFLDGHIGGNVDGLVVGLLQAPKALHIWEHKTVNEKKQAKLVALKASLGEKQALAAWDPVYYAQAQIYMHKMGADRHYLTVDSPGGRSTVTCRTNYDPEAALRFLAKAERIINAPRPASKISEDPGWYECRFCDFHDLCHEQAMPDRHCRSCMSSTPQEDGTWACEEHQKPIELGRQRVGCPDHLFHPDLIPGEPLKRDRVSVVYKMRDGTEWTNSKQF